MTLQSLLLEDLFSYSTSLEPVTSDAIEEHVCSLRNKKAPDIFGITVEHLKYASPVVIQALVQATNNILQTGKLGALTRC